MMHIYIYIYTHVCVPLRACVHVVVIIIFFSKRAVRVNAPPPKYNGYPGFQYPAAMWKLDGPRGPEIIFSYSVNKEDIALSRVPLSVLD